MRRLSIHLLPSPPCPCSSWWWFWVYHSPGPSASPWACPPWWPAAAEQGGVNIMGDQVRISPHHPHHKVGWSEARKVGGEWQKLLYLLMNDDCTHHDHGVARGPLPLLVLADLGGPPRPHEDVLAVLRAGEHLGVVLASAGTGTPHHRHHRYQAQGARTQHCSEVEGVSRRVP